MIFGIHPQATMVIALGLDTGNKNDNNDDTTYRSARQPISGLIKEILEGLNACENSICELIETIQINKEIRHKMYRDTWGLIMNEDVKEREDKETVVAEKPDKTENKNKVVTEKGTDTTILTTTTTTTKSSTKSSQRIPNDGQDDNDIQDDNPPDNKIMMKSEEKDKEKTCEKDPGNKRQYDNNKQKKENQGSKVSENMSRSQIIKQRCTKRLKDRNRRYDQ